MRWAVIGLTTFIAITGCGIIAFVVWLKYKNPQSFLSFQEILGGFGMIVVGLVFLAFYVLLFVNIVLWVFLPLMVYSIKKKLEEAVTEIKKLNNG